MKRFYLKVEFCFLQIPFPKRLFFVSELADGYEAARVPSTRKAKAASDKGSVKAVSDSQLSLH
jgi:hypothetical protein